MKKYLVIILTLAMLISVTACTDKPGTSSVPSSSAAGSTPASSEASEPVTLTFTGWRVEDQVAMDTMNQIFTSENPDITVTYSPVKATEYDAYIQTAFANGTAEDIIMVRSFTGGKTMYSSGKLLPLTNELVPALATNFSESGINGWSADDGTVFAIPGGMDIEAVHYNKGIFEECGITKVPETMPELYAACEKVAEKGYYPMAVGIKDAWYVSEEVTSSILMATIGTNDWVKQLYEKTIDFTDPKFIAMLKNLKDLSAYFPKNYEGLSYEDCQQMFISEQAAMYMSGSFELSYFIETNPDLELGCFAYPGEDSAPKAVNITLATGFGIYSETEYMDAALTYINWFASKEGSEVYSNNVVGFFGMNKEASTLTSPIANEWLALSAGREVIPLLGYEYMADQTPDYSTAVADAVYQMLIKGKTPGEAAAYMQEQMSWFFE